MGPNPMAMPMNMANMAAMAQARPGMPPNAAAQAGARPNFKYTSGVRNVAGAPVMPGQQQPQVNFKRKNPKCFHIFKFTLFAKKVDLLNGGYPIIFASNIFHKDDSI